MLTKEKTCSHCGQTKPLGDFYTSKKEKMGREGYCKLCRNSQRKEHWTKGRLPRQNSYLKYVHGITLEEYNNLLGKQGGVCALCGNINRHGVALHVDHDHTTGEIRGLLCFCCNSALGNAHDNPVILRKMADYLEGK